MSSKQSPKPAAADGSAATEAPAVATASAGPVMYLGPRMIAPVHLSPRSVYANGLPAEVAALASGDADLASCFVPVHQVGQAIRGEGAKALVEAVARITDRYRRK